MAPSSQRLASYRSKRAALGAAMPRPARRPSTRSPPREIGLQLARLVDSAPAGPGWLHEEKFDGYRVLLWRSGDTVRISSRGNQNWTARLARAARALQRLRCESCVLDGELVALDAEGKSSFGTLQERFGAAGGEAGLRLMVFDLLFVDGQDLRPVAQLERKKQLERLLKGAHAPLTLTRFSIGDGPQAARAACARGLEGIVSKAIDASYDDGRRDAWRKVKCTQSDEYAIIGYTAGRGARADLGSILLGAPGDAERWRYVGRVGTGFDESTIGKLLQRLQRTRSPVPLANAPSRAQLRGAQPLWVAPHVVVEVEFRGVTRDGMLRQASLKGVREDRDVGSLRPGRRNTARVEPEAPVAAPGRRGAKRAPREEGSVRLTHPERVLLREPRITKQDLAEFYRSIASSILPGLVNRPLMVLRCPEGEQGECFFQKHAMRGFPAVIRQIDDPSARRGWMYIDGLSGLLGLVQMNALEYHVWGTTVADLDSTDRLIIDLDPAADVSWKQVIAGALELRVRLERLDLQCFVRTTGGKGLHVILPLNPPVDWDPARSFARALAESMAKDNPRQYLAVAAKKQRAGKIYLDYLRNARGATAVCSYSLRNRPGAPLAAPLTWEELPRVRSADQFRFDNIRQRLARLTADPWDGIERVRQSLPDGPP